MWSEVALQLMLIINVWGLEISFFDLISIHWDKYVISTQSDLLKSQICENSDAQKNGGYTTTKIRDHCQDLTVSFTDGGPGYILKVSKSGTIIYKC